MSLPDQPGSETLVLCVEIRACLINEHIFPEKVFMKATPLLVRKKTVNQKTVRTCEIACFNARVMYSGFFVIRNTIYKSVKKIARE